MKFMVLSRKVIVVGNSNAVTLPPKWVSGSRMVYMACSDDVLIVTKSVDKLFEVLEVLKVGQGIEVPEA